MILEDGTFIPRSLRNIQHHCAKDMKELNQERANRAAVAFSAGNLSMSAFGIGPMLQSDRILEFPMPYYLPLRLCGVLYFDLLNF